MSCGTDAQNVDACRTIESARSEIAPACSASFDVDACKLFYRDACLVGIGNADAGEVTALIDPCIAAMKACTAAPDGGADLGCPGQVLHDGATCTNTDGLVLPLTACNILMVCPDALEACHWAARPPSTATDAGSDADADTGTGGSGGGG